MTRSDNGDEPTELKRMWVAGSARGLGIGRLILTELESQAAQMGATAHHWFEKQL